MCGGNFGVLGAMVSSCVEEEMEEFRFGHIRNEENEEPEESDDDELGVGVARLLFALT